MNERIKKIRFELKLTQEKFGEKIGIKKNSLSQIENGINGVSDVMIKSVCREFHVNEEWLRNGTGEMFNNEMNDSIDKFIKEFNLGDLEKTIISEYINLDDDHKEAIRDYIRNIASSLSVPLVQEHRLIQYYNRLASAGTGEVLFGVPTADTIEIPNLPEYKKVNYAVSVNGHSMEPLYQDGDTLLVDASGDIEHGQIGIFLVDDKAYVKKLGNGELISLNPEYPNIKLNDTAICRGKVVGKI